MLTSSERLRGLLGESIPLGGSDADTMFSETEIQDLLVRHETLTGAVIEGWDIKAAQFANLVDVQEGDSSRKMGSLAADARAMAQHFRQIPSEQTQPGTRQTRIDRGGAPW